MRLRRATNRLAEIPEPTPFASHPLPRAVDRARLASTWLISSFPELLLENNDEASCVWWNDLKQLNLAYILCPGVLQLRGFF